MQICPSMPFPNASDYVYQLRRLSKYFKYFQLDFADGIFVEEKTAPIEKVVELIVQTGGPLNDLTYDFHLMVKDYEPEIAKLEKLRNYIKIKNTFVHFSAINDFRNNPLKIGQFELGLVLNPEDRVDDIIKKISIEKIPYIQIMSVIPGAQGRPFIPETLNKIDQLRGMGYRSNIFLDGGVNEKTLTEIHNHMGSFDVVCPGSFLTKCPDSDLKKRYDYLLTFK